MSESGSLRIRLRVRDGRVRSMLNGHSYSTELMKVGYSLTGSAGRVGFAVIKP